MDIYLVRHGETGGNKAKRHQNEETPLTVEGKRQASLAAVYVATLNPTHLIVSDRVRAVETGKEIAAVTDLIPEVNSHFTELKRPQRLYGHAHKSVRSAWYLTRWFLGLHANTGTETAGESYRLLRHRIAAAQSDLAQLPADARVVVVTHSVFITLFVAHLCRARAA